MEIKSALAIMMAAGLMTPQTLNNPITGQTIQQQLISDKQFPSPQRKRKNRKAQVKSNGKLGNAFVVQNQRQKRKHWRQCPQRRHKASKRAA